ncbi:hypothetical protein HAX54_029629 [Datura stramonium]|uniref:Uncharacterized protein n=1 Tax=Datura stramonium TaxID=4076 RepID=A0ABS8V8Q5_DATST|nr:hypothetical protein [Datura stramonium]
MPQPQLTATSHLNRTSPPFIPVNSIADHPYPFLYPPLFPFHYFQLFLAGEHLLPPLLFPAVHKENNRRQTNSKHHLEQPAEQMPPDLPSISSLLSPIPAKPRGAAPITWIYHPSSSPPSSSFPHLLLQQSPTAASSVLSTPSINADHYTALTFLLH